MENTEIVMPQLRSEEVHDIIERMPQNFSKWVTWIILFMFFGLLSAGYLIKYPDVVTGVIVINPSISPVKLVANSTGKIVLLVKSQQTVAAGQIIGYIENSTNLQDVKRIKAILSLVRPNSDHLVYPPVKFSDIVLTGQLALKYARFVNTFQLLYDLQNDNYYQTQENQLQSLVEQNKNILRTENEQLSLNFRNLQFMSKFKKRDSTLFAQEAESESDMDKTQMNYITIAQNYKNSQKDIISTSQQIYESQNKIEQIMIEKDEKERQYKIDFQSAYSDLDGMVKDWEEKYCFISPYSGTLDYLQFWQNKEFIQAGQESFSIIPSQKSILGRMMLPITGSGKVKIDQEVIVKLDSYPFEEFGSVKGRVSSISLTTNIAKDATQNSVSQYLVTVDLPNKLETNYGSSLSFKYELRGVGDIVTADRRIIQRLFDNLKYRLQ